MSSSAVRLNLERNQKRANFRIEKKNKKHKQQSPNLVLWQQTKLGIFR